MKRGINQTQLKYDFLVQFNPDLTGTLNGFPLSIKSPLMKFHSGEYSLVRSDELPSSSSLQGRHPSSSEMLQRSAVTGELVSADTEPSFAAAAGTALRTRKM